ncbi:hypothetical protein ACV4QK_20855 (plasmid) [Alteromonas macleodii]
MSKPCNDKYVKLVQSQQNIEVILVGDEEVEFRKIGQTQTETMSRKKFDDLVSLLNIRENF